MTGENAVLNFLKYYKVLLIYLPRALQNLAYINEVGLITGGRKVRLRISSADVMNLWTVFVNFVYQG